ncbi:MAG: tripartite tricarboxylate transporter permease, partial [Planctomycetales bacterium]|nr:tripartite tricarboxylate transporter permease [Planctomycetales bacterium]
MLEHLLDAAVRIASPEVALAMLASALYGLFVGSVPGLTATMAVALLVPFTFFMSDVAATASIVTLTATAIFAGDIPGTLVRIPGTPSSAAYTNDGYALTKQGRHGEALTSSLVGSVVGGLIGSLILIVAARQLSKIATLFTSYENFWLVVLGLTCAAVVSQGSPLKGALSLVIGLFAATIGLSEVHAAPRFTFGVDEMIGGVNFIPAMIGLFGGSEVLRIAVHGRIREDAPEKPPEETTGLIANFFKQLARAWMRRWDILRSGKMGTIVGMLPGAGADIAAWMSYAVSRKR